MTGSMIFEEEITESFVSLIPEELTADNELPEHVKQWLSEGTMATSITENYQKQQIWLFTSKDCKTISYKVPETPNDQVLCTIQIKKIFNMPKGYHNTDISPFVKASKNDKPPAKSHCFTLIGPFTNTGRNHMHIICENSMDAQKWTQNIELVRKRHRLRQ